MTENYNLPPVPELPDQLLPAGEAQDPDAVVMVLCTHPRPRTDLPCPECAEKLQLPDGAWDFVDEWDEPEDHEG